MSAIAFFNKLFTQKNKCIDNEIKIDKNENSDSQIHCFKNLDGSIIVVAWLQTNGKSERGSDVSGNVKDTRVEKVSIRIPLKLNGNANSYSEIGNANKLDGKIIRGNSTELNELNLYGGKIAIIKINK
jgi:hypothetical protein